jgi:hypothetical protein
LTTIADLYVLGERIGSENDEVALAVDDDNDDDDNVAAEGNEGHDMRLLVPVLEVVELKPSLDDILEESTLRSDFWYNC